MVKDIFLELCEKLELLCSPGLGINKIWYWDYYHSVIKKEIADSEERSKIYRQIYHLEKMKYFSRKGLTAKGVLQLIKRSIKIQSKHGKWDKKWRIIIFDIPEKIKKKRDVFRADIKRAGFIMLQNSIWISPFGNFDNIQKLVKEYRISKYVVFIVADEISNDFLYAKSFNIKIK